MRIRLTKISDQRHGLELVRRDGSREQVELATREALFHDFLHYAVESSIPTQQGFWGTLASGKTMADLNDRSGAAVAENAAVLGAVEGTVGMLTGVIKDGVPGDQVVATVRRFHEQLGRETPKWYTESFVLEVRERMRRLLGHWKATPFGESMEISWAEVGRE